MQLMEWTSPFGNDADNEPVLKRPAAKARGGNPRAATITVAAASGKRKVTGNKKEMKGSQVYPARFALQVVRLHWPDRFTDK